MHFGFHTADPKISESKITSPLNISQTNQIVEKVKQFDSNLPKYRVIQNFKSQSINCDSRKKTRGGTLVCPYGDMCDQKNAEKGVKFSHGHGGNPAFVVNLGLFPQFCIINTWEKGLLTGITHPRLG